MSLQAEWYLADVFICFSLMFDLGFPQVSKSPEFGVFSNQDLKSLKLDICAEKVMKKSSFWLVVS